jgi:hypothetical protein
MQSAQHREFHEGTAEIILPMKMNAWLCRQTSQTHKKDRAGKLFQILAYAFNFQESVLVPERIYGKIEMTQFCQSVLTYQQLYSNSQ